MVLLAAIFGYQTSVAYRWHVAVYRGEFWPQYRGDRGGEVCRWTGWAALLAEAIAAMASWLALAGSLVFSCLWQLWAWPPLGTSLWAA